MLQYVSAVKMYWTSRYDLKQTRKRYVHLLFCLKRSNEELSAHAHWL